MRNITNSTIDVQLFFPANTSKFLHVDSLNVIWDFNYYGKAKPGFNQSVFVPKQ